VQLSAGVEFEIEKNGKCLLEAIYNYVTAYVYRDLKFICLPCGHSSFFCFFKSSPYSFSIQQFWFDFGFSKDGFLAEAISDVRWDS